MMICSASSRGGNELAGGLSETERESNRLLFKLKNKYQIREFCFHSFSRPTESVRDHWYYRIEYLIVLIHPMILEHYR